jgi:histone-lysine N-methyltransferase SETD2/UMP-CMP kinase
MSVNASEVVDPQNKGNLARFINHSCNPNCETQKWNVCGEICVGIFARRSIEEDEELSFDYRFDTHKTALMKCLCGAHNCRRYLGVIPTEYRKVDDYIEKLEQIKCQV